MWTWVCGVECAEITRRDMLLIVYSEGRGKEQVTLIKGNDLLCGYAIGVAEGPKEVG
jgi:hypothetical protein